MQAGSPDWEESPTLDGLYSLQLDGGLRFEDVAAEAGDIPADVHTRQRLARLRRVRGAEFCADLWFVLTHQRLDHASARERWTKALAHRERLARLLGRNVGIAVAALDYLHNAEGVLKRPVLLDARRLQRIANAATHDELTGLFDRRALQQVLDRELARARRERQPVGVLMIDVDHFKRFNDVHGHLEGDAALQHVALSCVRNVRDMDVVCRYGGEEFCVVLPGAAHVEAAQTAERIRRAVGADGIVTVSIGVASTDDGCGTGDALLWRADQAMYAAKTAGRNRTYSVLDGGAEPVSPREG